MERNEQTYDRELFLEVIASYPAIKFLRSDNREEYHVQFYEGITGKVVMIDTTDLDDSISFSEGIGLLNELGLPYLIDVLFPPIKPPTEDQEIAVMEDAIMKESALKSLDS